MERGAEISFIPQPLRLNFTQSGPPPVASVAPMKSPDVTYLKILSRYL